MALAVIIGAGLGLTVLSQVGPMDTAAEYIVREKGKALSLLLHPHFSFLPFAMADTG
jgi:hypothetical protein